MAPLPAPTTRRPPLATAAALTPWPVTAATAIPATAIPATATPATATPMVTLPPTAGRRAGPRSTGRTRFPTTPIRATPTRRAHPPHRRPRSPRRSPLLSRWQRPGQPEPPSRPDGTARRPIRLRRGIRTAATWSRPPPPAIPPSRRWDTRTGRPTPGTPFIPATTAVTRSRPTIRPGPSGTPQPSGNGAAGPPGPSGPPAHPAGAGEFAQPGGYPEADYADDGGYGNGYPGQAPYADSYGTATAGYVPSYPADGYPADQYGQDGYGGYPAGQG